MCIGSPLGRWLPQRLREALAVDEVELAVDSLPRLWLVQADIADMEQAYACGARRPGERHPAHLAGVWAHHHCNVRDPVVAQ